MEVIIFLSYLIMVVFGILQIILFYKIWRMTDNVRRIHDKVGNKDFLMEASIAYMKGDIDEAEIKLNEAFIQEMHLCYKEVEEIDGWNFNCKKIEEKYQTLFKKLGRPVPDFKKYQEIENYLMP